MSSSQLNFIFFKGVGQPPTSIWTLVWTCIVSKFRFDVHKMGWDPCLLSFHIIYWTEIQTSRSKSLWIQWIHRCFPFIPGFPGDFPRFSRDFRPRFSRDFPRFSSDFPRYSKDFFNFLGISPDFPRISPDFLGISPKDFLRFSHLFLRGPWSRP